MIVKNFIVLTSPFNHNAPAADPIPQKVWTKYTASTADRRVCRTISDASPDLVRLFTATRRAVAWAETSRLLQMNRNSHVS
jgi:hypothetical protein